MQGLAVCQGGIPLGVAMCGICGFTGQSDKALLKKMAGTLIHRGPDEEGYYTDDAVNLAIRRLSIIDPASHQPIHNEDKTLWVVFNGEIYNFQKLRWDLKSKGHRFYTHHSDTEVIVHLYEEYGTEFVHKMNGMFAIALWDRAEEKLLLIRDRMGVKPLFYSLINNNIVFASEIKAILEHPDYVRGINYDALYHYFTFKNVPAPLTAFRDIYSLLPGEMLTFYRGSLEKKRYWKLRFQERHDYSEEFVAQKIIVLLKDAVRLRMISDVPFGAYLSGGVDSSTVVALMTRFSDKPVKTFSLGYEDELKNKEADLYYARKVSEAYRTRHHEYIMSSKEVPEEMGNVIRAFDQPFSGTISTYFLTRLIGRHVKVALSGDGADELFGSYLSHRTAQPMHHFSRLHGKANDEEELFAPCDIEYLAGLYDISGGDSSKWRYALCLFSDEEKRDLLSDKFRANLNNPDSYSLLKSHFDAASTDDPLNRILEVEWNTQFPDQVLAFVDFLSMAHSVEIRSPFLDYRLVEFAATIPGSMKIKSGNVKDILKKAVETLLPEGITRRPKEGFVLPVFEWMENELRDYCKELLSEDRMRRHDLLNIDAVKGIVDSYFAGNKGNAGKVWNLMMFQVWWEAYFGED